MDAPTVEVDIHDKENKIIQISRVTAFCIIVFNYIPRKFIF